MRTLSLLVASATIVAAAGCTVKPSPTVNANKLAACLTERGVVMYGADWCAHCQEQKRLFGTAFPAVTYVECPDSPQRCVQAGITGYPAWVLPDGRKFEGVQPLSTLAGVAGCAKSVTP